eukprot:4429035-Amphidinium_carterae.1
MNCEPLHLPVALHLWPPASGGEACCKAVDQSSPKSQSNGFLQASLAGKLPKFPQSTCNN